jgi:hypothetical protein
VHYVPIQYPTNSSAYWIELWCNRTLAANRTIPKIWMSPAWIWGNTNSIPSLLGRYDTILALLDTFSSFVSYARAPYDMNRSFPKLLVPAYAYESNIAPAVKLASTLPGKRLAFVFNGQYGFQELESLLLANASSQLGVSYTPFRVDMNNVSISVINITQELIRTDPELVIFDGANEANRLFIQEVRPDIPAARKSLN